MSLVPRVKSPGGLSAPFVGTASLVLGLAFATAGCVTRLDMATAYDEGRAATTIPYAGVRGARQFPDYEPIGSAILTGKDPGPAPKGRTPKGGAK
jgi:hypothetical protein